MKEPSFEHLELERFVFGAQTRISKEAMHFAVAPKEQVREELDYLILTIRQEIFGQRVQSITEQWPDDWWQAVKERFAPRWFRRYWPVKYHVLSVDVKALYPEICPPKHTPVMHMAILRGTSQNKGE